jgi:hypothetical protein
MGSIYTPYLAYPIATPDVVRNEIRAAVEEGRAPIPLRVTAANTIPLMPFPVAPTPAPAPTPLVPLLRSYAAPPVTTSVPAATVTPAPVSAPTRMSPAVRGLLFGGAAIVVGLGVAYFVFR